MRLYKFTLYDRDENEIDTVTLPTEYAERALDYFKNEFSNSIPDFTGYYVEYTDWEWRSDEEGYHGN